MKFESNEIFRIILNNYILFLVVQQEVEEEQIIPLLYFISGKNKMILTFIF